MFQALIQLPANLQPAINMHATPVYCPLTNQMRITPSAEDSGVTDCSSPQSAICIQFGHNN